MSTSHESETERPSRVAAPSSHSGRVQVVGLISLIAGVVLVIAGAVTYVVVQQTLSDQKITVSDDANCAAGDEVNGPISAFCQADVINTHAMSMTGGKTYAQLDRDDPNRETVMTASFLQASLFTSVVAFGVAAMAVGMGILFVLLGWAMMGVAKSMKASAYAAP